MADWSGLRPEDVEMVQGYANSVRGLWPEVRLRCGVIYTMSSQGFRFFEISVMVPGFEF